MEHGSMETSMSCYYLEDFDESDNTFWHYLYFTDGGDKVRGK